MARNAGARLRLHLGSALEIKFLIISGKVVGGGLDQPCVGAVSRETGTAAAKPISQDSVTRKA